MSAWLIVIGASSSPSCSNGSRSWSVPPGQPIHTPWLARITGSMAVTRPPGEVRQPLDPSGSTTLSTGSRLATITRS